MQHFHLRMTLSHALHLKRSFRFSLNPPGHSLVTLNYDSITTLLKSCTQTSEIHQLHGYMVKTGLDKVPFTLSKLLAASILDMGYAASIFNSIPNPNLFMFNTMLRGYSISSYPKQAFPIFIDLKARGILLDQFSFITMLKACTRESAVGTGTMIHGIAVRSGHIMFINVKNTLLHFYCDCKRIIDAHRLFDEFPEINDLVTWNTLMAGYLHVSQPALVLDTFKELCLKELKASIATVLSLLTAASDLENFCIGASIHGYCIRVGFSSELHVITALIDMYAKAGHINLARRIFDRLATKDVVMWNCLIDKYARSSLVEEAVVLLQLMKFQGVKANSSTLAGLLSACASSGLMHLGYCITNYMEDDELKFDAILGTALINLYAKCGFLENAIKIFNRIEKKDVKCWTAMISSYGIHGQVKNAIKIFHWMEREGCRPNEVTFLAVLSACSHGGLITEGMTCFEKMTKEYGLCPDIEHYGCIVDLLGRAGMLDEAHKLIKGFPVNDDATAWRALLAACRTYGNVEMGENVKEGLTKYFNGHPTDSLLLSSTYAVAGRLPIMQNMKEAILKKEKYCEAVAIDDVRLTKEAGLSTIEIDDHRWELNCNVMVPD